MFLAQGYLAAMKLNDGKIIQHRGMWGEVLRWPSGPDWCIGISPADRHNSTMCRVTRVLAFRRTKGFDDGKSKKRELGTIVSPVNGIHCVMLICNV